MSGQQQKSGKPWSGQNKIPTINQFLENLDRDKKDRDAQVDAQSKTAGSAETTPQKSGLFSKKQTGGEEVADHVNRPSKTKNGKTVTDPTTGKQVIIEDVGKEFMKNVDEPMVPAPLTPSHTITDDFPSFLFRMQILESPQYDLLLKSSSLN